MRALKIIGIVGVSVIGVIVIAAIGLLLWVDPNDYRDDIESLVQQQTGRPLEIAGPIDLKLFPRLSLAIKDVKLGNPPNYGSEPFLRVQSASLGVKLRPLLQRRIEIGRVAIEGLEARLISRGATENNWKDLTEAHPAEPERPATATASIAGIDISNSTLVYRDEAEPGTVRVSALELHTGTFGGTEPVRIETTFDFDQGGPSPLANARLVSTVRIVDDGSVIELLDLAADLKWHGEPDEGGQQAAAWPIEVRSPKIRVDLRRETLDPASLALRVADLALQATASGERIFGDRLIAGRLTIPTASPRGVLRSLDIDVPPTADPKALSELEMSADYRLSENSVALSKMALRLDETRIDGSLSVDDFETSRLSFDLRVDALDLDRYLAPEEEKSGAAKSGTSKAAASPQPAPTPLPVDALRKLNAKGTLAIGRLRYAGLDLTQARIPLDAANGMVRSSPSEARLYGGRYQGSTVIDATPPQARLSVDAQLQAVELGPMLKALFDSSRIAGRGNVTAKLSAAGNTTDALIRSLSGHIENRVTGGAIEGVDLWYELRRARALFARQAPPARAGAARTEFKTLSATADITKGVARNDDLRIDMDYLKASGRGTLDLTSKSLDYRLVAEVYKLPSDSEANDMASLRAAEIPISVTGTLDEMKIRPDLQSLVKARVKDKAEELKEKVGGKLGDKLKDLFGR